MNLKNIIGQIIRDYIGMPSKVHSYNFKLDLYKEIYNCINSIEASTIKYFEETVNYNWVSVGAKKKQIESMMIRKEINLNEYSLQMSLVEELNQVLANFIDHTDQYFVKAYQNRLFSIKNTNPKDIYIAQMNFDSWRDMKDARNIASLAVRTIENHDDYIDSKKIDKFSKQFKYERYIRRGR